MVTESATKNKSPSPEQRQRSYIYRLRTRPAGEVEAPDKSLWNGLFDAVKSVHEQQSKYGPDAGVKSLDALAINLPELDALIKPPAPKRWHSIADLDAMPPHQWLMDCQGVKIPKRSITLLAARSGEGKTFAALDWFLFAGQNAPGIFIAAEKAHLFKARADAWYRHHGKQPTGREKIYTTPVDFADADATDQFIADARQNAPGCKLIVIDTLARCMTGDENSARDMGAFIDGVETVKNALDCTVVLVHHTGKSGHSERGSSALRAACDCVIELAQNDGVITLNNTKMSGAPEWEPVHMRLLPVEIGNDASGQPITCPAIVPSDRVIEDTEILTPNQRTVIEWLASDVFDAGARSSDLKQATGLANTSFYRALHSLSRRKLIEKEGKYDPWILTDSGRELAVSLKIIPPKKPVEATA